MYVHNKYGGVTIEIKVHNHDVPLILFDYHSPWILSFDNVATIKYVNKRRATFRTILFIIF